MSKRQRWQRDALEGSAVNGANVVEEASQISPEA
jgi:hypothetical protein